MSALGTRQSKAQASTRHESTHSRAAGNELMIIDTNHALEQAQYNAATLRWHKLKRMHSNAVQAIINYAKVSRTLYWAIS